MAVWIKALVDWQIRQWRWWLALACLLFLLAPFRGSAFATIAATLIATGFYVLLGAGAIAVIRDRRHEQRVKLDNERSARFAAIERDMCDADGRLLDMDAWLARQEAIREAREKRQREQAAYMDRIARNLAMAVGYRDPRDDDEGIRVETVRR